jgi:CDP-paratose 2-epimerase
MLVTGSSGLVGSEVSEYFHVLGWHIHGIDNNQRENFFGPQGNTRWNQKRLQKNLQNYLHYEVDIRNRSRINNLVKETKPDAIVHTAAQPSHDKAASIPFEDFDINAVGTLNLLEAVKQSCPEAPFVHMSTNKVYGDAPNEIPLIELNKRYDYNDDNFKDGIPETFRIDQSKHSIFGASKVAADIMVQEYGRYFNIPTCCLRSGCLTGPNHSGVELHGFLNYLVKCNIEGIKYKVYGYKGKQVRDNLHSYDVARFIEEFIENPKVAEVYNLGGGKKNTCSILEAFDILESISNKKMIYEYFEKNREGDHICYYSDLSKIKKDYPKWEITKSLSTIFDEIFESCLMKNLKTKD